jgi:hypothetical protein
MSDEIKQESRNKYPIIPRKKDNQQLISNLVAAFLDYPLLEEFLSDTSPRYVKIQE